jgi:putative aldouronate transport system substrate-binding protein
MSKFPAMLAAKEPMDIAFNFSFTRASFLDAGYIVDASKYTDYTKDIAQTLGEDVNAGYVGDFLVGFPMMNSRCFPSAIFVRKDIFDALGYKESDFNVNTDDMSSFDQITQMLAKIKEKYPDIIPFDGNRTFLQNYLTYADGFGDSFGVLENYGQTTKITNWYESEQCRQFALLARKWFTGGYTSKDIAVSKDTGRDKMKTGKSASFFASYVANQVGNIKTMTGYDTVCIPVSLKVKTTTAVNGALNSVMYQSKDKVKAFQFLNWIYTSADFNNLLNWGVPGKDWVVNKDGFADFPEGVTLATVNYHEDFGFIYPNQYLMTPWVGNPKDIWDQYRAFDKDNILSKAYGFSFNPASVVNELGQCSTVLTKYESDIGFGVVDPLPALEKFNKELKAAGLQKIIDEKQKQLDAWLATKK